MLLLAGDADAAPQLAAKLQHPYDLAVAPLMAHMSLLDLHCRDTAAAALKGEWSGLLHIVTHSLRTLSCIKCVLQSDRLPT